MFMLGALSGQPSGMTNPIAKLQHWWDCDEVGTNVVRYDSHGFVDIDTLTGGVDERAGLYNNGMDFNSTSDYCSTGPNTFTGDTSFAMCQWVYLDTTSGNDWIAGRTGTMSGSSVPASWHVWKSGGGSVQFNISADGSLNDWDGSTVNSVALVGTGAWHFIYWDYDAATSEMRISVDNETPVTATSAYDLNASGHRLWWGLMTPTYPHGLDGAIDSIAYFDGPLTDSERAWMWNGGAGRQYSEINQILPILDTFTAADATVLTGRQTDAGYRTWRAVTGFSELRIYTNQATAWNAGVEHRNTLTIPNPDYTWEIDLQNGTGFAHTVLYLKYIDENNWIRYGRVNTVQESQLIRKINGTELSVDFVAGDPTNTAKNVRVLVNGTSYEVYDRDTSGLVVAGRISDPIFADAKQIALYGFYDNGMYYDNFNLDAAPVESDLFKKFVAGYDFDGNLNDYGGSWPLNQQSGTPTYATGKVSSQCADLTGAWWANWQTPNSFLNSGTEDRSFCCWINPDQVSAYQTYFGLFAAGSISVVAACDWRLDVFSSDFRHYHASGGSWYYAGTTTAPALNIGTWYWVYGEYTGADNTLRISVDNGTLDSGVITGTPNSNDNQFAVGRQPTGQYSVDGKLNQLLFFKGTLTASERAFIYNGGTGRATNTLGIG